MRARLINPERVTIQPISRGGTRTDDLAAEPTAHTERQAQVVLQAQVDTSNENRRQPGQGGANLAARVQLTFLRTDVQASGWAPADGDLVVEIADRDGGNARDVRWPLTAPQLTAKEYHRAKLITVDVQERPASRARTEGI